MPDFNPVTLNEAYNHLPDYRPLTNGYWPEEYWMLRNVIADLRKDGIPFALVCELFGRPGFISVWRKPSLLFRQNGEPCKP